MRRLCEGVVVATGLTLPAFGQGVPPLGTWKLNREKSTFVGPAQRVGTRLRHQMHKVVKNSGGGIDAQGQEFKYTFTHIYDGKPHPVSGFGGGPTPPFNEDTYNKVKTNAMNFVRSKDGKPVQIGSLALSDDGKVVTLPSLGLRTVNSFSV